MTMITDLHKFMVELSSALALSHRELLTIILKAPTSYKVYSIPKKSGGQRVIAQPARQTKYVQNVLIEKYLTKLPVHECASAYKKGASIKKNAYAHKENIFLAKFDLENFFNSITLNDLQLHFKRHLSEYLDPQAQSLMAICCCVASTDRSQRVLSVGAPTSPMLSNSIMYEFDKEIYDWCIARNITYTRYADDLTFSTNEKNISFEIEKKLLRTLQLLKYPALNLNSKKTIYSSKKNKRRITGLIIDNENKISLGRERKRSISAMIHKFSIGVLPSEELAKLQGLLGLAEDVEPLFNSRMRAKYGHQIISAILSHRAPPKKIGRNADVIQLLNIRKFTEL